jgi:hypothetical protein
MGRNRGTRVRSALADRARRRCGARDDGNSADADIDAQDGSYAPPVKSRLFGSKWTIRANTPRRAASRRSRKLSGAPVNDRSTVSMASVIVSSQHPVTGGKISAEVDGIGRMVFVFVPASDLNDGRNDLGPLSFSFGAAVSPVVNGAALALELAKGRDLIGPITEGRVLINPVHPMSAVGAKTDFARTALHVAERLV